MTVERNHAREPEDVAHTQELVPGTSNITRSIAETLVIKDRNLFLVADHDGSVPMHAGHGLGLYYHDCRYLNGYTLTVCGTQPQPLVWDDADGHRAVVGLTNATLRMPGGQELPKESLEIRWERIVHGGELLLLDDLVIHNLTMASVSLELELSFQADFEDLFVVRGLQASVGGELISHGWDRDVLHFLYEGADRVYRALKIRFDREPDRKRPSSAIYRIGLEAHEKTRIGIALMVCEERDRDTIEQLAHPTADAARAAGEFRRSVRRRLGRETHVESDSFVLDRVLEQSMLDLELLRSTRAEGEYFSAGVPWFATLFGRDSIITAMQTLAFDPNIAKETILLLARFQGAKEDAWRDEEPGKILHELRVGELANVGEIPFTPYFGTVDATPLWLMLIGQHAAWTGDLTVFRELHQEIEAALDWIDRSSGRDPAGFLAYQGNPEKGLVNQGWKDSWDAVVNADGSLATPPIALCEVQGYVYAARVAIADLYEREGDLEAASRLRATADALRARFDEAFWVSGGFYALALQEGGQPAAVVASNMGHALWTGIAEPSKGRRIVERLMEDDMFNGWGIRTLSRQDRRYNPLGYHLGTVWPHDTSIVGNGMKRYGADEAALRLLVALIEAAVHFEDDRLPELFGGFERLEYRVPVKYPVACKPQAWAAGAIPYLLTTTLGLEPDGFERRLRIVRPALPPYVKRLHLRQLRVGGAIVDLSFDNTGAQVEVEGTCRTGDLRIETERPS